MDITLNPNQRLIPQLDQAGKTHEYTLLRVTKAVLPLLSLLQPIGMLAQAGTLGVEVYEDFRADAQSALSKTALKVALIASLVFLPILTQTALHGIEAYKQLANAYKATNSRDFAMALFKASHSIVYIATLYTASAEILLISMVAQTAMEIYRTYDLANKGFTLEAIIQSVVVVIRGNAVYSQVMKTYKKTVERPVDKHTYTYTQVKSVGLQTKVDSGVTRTDNKIRIDNENLDLKLTDETISLGKENAFDVIEVHGKKVLLGSILHDIANNFNKPKVLELDLFYLGDKLEASEEAVRTIFSKWENSGVEVVFLRYGNVDRSFKL